MITIKIKQLASICTRKRSIYLYDAEDGTQWAGTSDAIYPLEGLPEVDLAQLGTMLDIPMDKQADMVTQRAIFPTAMVEPSPIGATSAKWSADDTISYYGQELIPISTSSGETYLLDARLIRPIDSDKLQLFVKGKTIKYILAMDGLFPAAVLFPTTITNELLSWMGEIYSGLNNTKRSGQP